MTLDRRLRETFGACVTMTHHVGHGAKSRARGAYPIGAALDFQRRLDRPGDVVTVTCTKSRDVEPPARAAARKRCRKPPGLERVRAALRAYLLDGQPLP